MRLRLITFGVLAWAGVFKEISAWARDPHQPDCQCQVCHALREAFIGFYACPWVSPLASGPDVTVEELLKAEHLEPPAATE